MNHLWRVVLKPILLIAAFSAAAEPAIPPSTVNDDQEVIAAISQQIETFGRDLEQLRLFMGVRKIDELDIGIRSAIPRDLYFQTQTLWQKTDRLLFEIARVHTQPPALAGNMDWSEILHTLRQAHQTLQQIMSEVRLTDTVESTPPPLKADLFMAILSLNRQMDSLLERHFAPSDVYAEITLAVGYAARLLARHPDAIRIPEEPPFEANRQPSDVYHRLMGCLQRITRIFHALKLPVLTLDASQTDTAQLTPNDVFVVASLIVSQLDFLHKHLGVAKPPPPRLYPGLKFPAHSYQRAGVLHAQLEQLECYAVAHCSMTLGSARHESAVPKR